MGPICSFVAMASVLSSLQPASAFSSYRSWMVENWQKKYHRVNMVCCSPDGRVMVAGDSVGRVALFSLSKCMEPEYWLGDANSSSHPKCEIYFRSHEQRTNTLLSSREFLISSDGVEIKFWKWTDLLAELSKPSTPKERQPPCKIFPIANRYLSLTEHLEKETLIYISPKGSVSIFPLSGPTDQPSLQVPSLAPVLQAKAVCLLPGGQFAVGYEDGVVRVWNNNIVEKEIFGDNISTVCWKNLEEYLEHLRRLRSAGTHDELGSIQCMASSRSGEWLVIGSSRHYLALYNLAVDAFTMAVPLCSVPSRVLFHGTEIISVGGDKYVTHWSLTGSQKFRAKASSNTLSDVYINSGDNQSSILLACGNSSRIDVFSDFYRASFSFTFPTD